jgi:hypothetical protein
MTADLAGYALTGLFHTATGTAFADIAVNGQRETWPIRGSRFRAWLRRCHYEATRTALDAGVMRSTLDFARSSTHRNGQCLSASPNKAAASTSTLLMSTGAPLRSGPMDGV